MSWWSLGWAHHWKSPLLLVQRQLCSALKASRRKGKKGRSAVRRQKKNTHFAFHYSEILVKVCASIAGRVKSREGPSGFGSTANCPRYVSADWKGCWLLGTSGATSQQSWFWLWEVFKVFLLLRKKYLLAHLLVQHYRALLTQQKTILKVTFSWMIFHFEKHSALNYSLFQFL